MDEDPAIARLREAVDAFSRQDLDVAMAVNRADVELVRARGLPPLQGHDAVREWMKPDAFESQVIELFDAQRIGDKIFGRLHNRVRGSGSGIETEFDVWGVWTLDDKDMVARLEIFQPSERDAALEAAGLKDAT